MKITLNRLDTFNLAMTIAHTDETNTFYDSRPESVESRSPPSYSISSTNNSIRESNIIKIGPEKKAIAACKSLVLENSGFIVENSDRKDEMPVMDPLTFPIVRLSRASDVADGPFLHLNTKTSIKLALAL